MNTRELPAAVPPLKSLNVVGLVAAMIASWPAHPALFEAERLIMVGGLVIDYIQVLIRLFDVTYTTNSLQSEIQGIGRVDWDCRTVRMTVTYGIWGNSNGTHVHPLVTPSESSN